MPLFQIANETLKPVAQTSFKAEKNLQKLIETNLLAAFNCRFVASEFGTGNQHSGRIDTLALSEDNNPVIIEYKCVESSDLVNQSLFYLHWLSDHRGDFEVAARKKLGDSIIVDWSDIRVICLAPNFKRYDLHAVRVMGANIELWRYRLFANSTLYVEEVFRQAMNGSSDSGPSGKNPVMVAAGKKARQTAISGLYTWEEHLVGKAERIQQLAAALRDSFLALDPSITEAPKKFYVAYKTTQNIVCMEIRKSRIMLFLKLDPKTIANPPKNSRDVSNVGHYGTGDFEFVVESEVDIPIALHFAEAAFNAVGG